MTTRAAEALASVMALHRPIDLVAAGQYRPGADDAVICLECSAHHDDAPHLWPYWVVVYPCPTVRLVAGASEERRS